MLDRGEKCFVLIYNLLRFNDVSKFTHFKIKLSIKVCLIFVILCIYSLILHYNFVRFLAFCQYFYVVFHVGYKSRKNAKKGCKSLKDHEVHWKNSTL